MRRQPANWLRNKSGQKKNKRGSYWQLFAKRQWTDVRSLVVKNIHLSWAASCAALALLGSANNTVCKMVLQWTAHCNNKPEDVARVIYLYLGSFSAFQCYENKVSPTCCKALWLYINWVECIYGCNMWRWFAETICVFEPKFHVHRGEITCSETFFRLILSEKHWFPTKTIHQLFISDVKMLLLVAKVRKAYEVLNFFCLQFWRNSRHFFKRKDWRASKFAHTYHVFPLWNRPFET